MRKASSLISFSQQRNTPSAWPFAGRCTGTEKHCFPLRESSVKSDFVAKSCFFPGRNTSALLLTRPGARSHPQGCAAPGGLYCIVLSIIYYSYCNFKPSAGEFVCLIQENTKFTADCAHTRAGPFPVFRIRESPRGESIPAGAPGAFLFSTG